MHGLHTGDVFGRAPPASYSLPVGRVETSPPISGDLSISEEVKEGQERFLRESFGLLEFRRVRELLCPRESRALAHSRTPALTSRLQPQISFCEDTMIVRFRVSLRRL